MTARTEKLNIALVDLLALMCADVDRDVVVVHSVDGTQEAFSIPTLLWHTRPDRTVVDLESVACVELLTFEEFVGSGRLP